MYTRVLTIRGAKNFDKAVTYCRETALPILNQQKGYRGISISADRSGGVLGILSLWETAPDRDASESAISKARQELLDIVGGELTVENFEEVLAEVSKPPAPGAALMVTRISMDPVNVDENAAFFKSEIVPRIKANRGFLALRQMINRQSGQGLVGTLWADQDALKAAAADAQSRRQEAGGRGVSFLEDSYREVLLSETR
jgi:heme-degrading monooxygenase HmoA